MKIGRYKYGILLVHLMFIGIFFFILQGTPYLWDDLKLVQTDVSGSFFESLGKMIAAVADYRNTLGDRVISYFLTCLFCAKLPKVCYNIVCTFAIACFVHTIYKISSYHHKDSLEKIGPYIVLSIYLMLWFFTYPFTETLLWPSASISYVWQLIPVMWFLFYLLYKKPEKLSGDIAVFFLGLISGQAVENTSCALTFILVVIIIYKLFGKIKITRTEWMGTIGEIIGFAILMSAPGNYVRSSDASSFESSNILMKYGYRIARETYYLVRVDIVPLGILLATFLLAIYYTEKKKGEKVTLKELFEKYYAELIVFVLMLLSVYDMTFAAAYAVRVCFTFTAFSFLLICRFGSDVIIEARCLDSAKTIKIFKRVAGSILGAILILVFVEVTTGYMEMKTVGRSFDRPKLYHVLDWNEGVLPGNATDGE